MADDTVAAPDDSQGSSFLISSRVKSIESKILDSEPRRVFSGPRIVIPRVEDDLRRGNANSYNPKVIPIGPYHHGKSHLQAMEGYKHQFLRDLLERNSLGIKDCIHPILDLESRARECYRGDIHNLSTDDFVKMLVLDSAFVIEIFMKKNENTHPSDFLPYYSLVKRDMLLFENQLPFFVLECMFDCTMASVRAPSLEKLAINFFGLRRKGSPELPLHSVHHLLHLYQSQFRPPIPPPNPSQSTNFAAPSACPTPSATILGVMGIKFERTVPPLLTDVKFTEHTKLLEVPYLFIEEDNVTLFFNLIAFEQFNISLGTHFTSYAVFMRYMLSKAEDVELLSERAIIEHRLANHQEVVHLFQDLSSGVIIDPGNDSISVLLRDVKKFSESNLAVLKRSFMQAPWWHNLFKDPVAIIISVLGGGGIWFLTFLQTFFTIYRH